ncbi:MAG TPA: putative quinol monooxygenase [Ilumatobacteraceae bacterium]|nr:putative quinol monooxygenase [Ilumatobacteraceae bacterium]
MTKQSNDLQSSEQMIAIIGWIDVDPADRDALVAGTVDLQRATRDDEPGCLGYTISADPVIAGRMQIVELWQDAASLEAHFAHPNFHATGAAMRTVPRLGGSAIKYRIDAVDPVRGPDGTASATFWSTGG